MSEYEVELRWYGYAPGSRDDAHLKFIQKLRKDIGETEWAKRCPMCGRWHPCQCDIDFALGIDEGAE